MFAVAQETGAEAAGETSLLAQTSQVKEPGLSSTLTKFAVYVSSLQRTCADKIPAMRSWGGVGGADIKNPATPPAPQTRRTTEY